MASGGANKVVRIWDVATATPTSTLHVSRLMPACVQTHACITQSVNKRLAWPEQGKVGWDSSVPKLVIILLGFIQRLTWM